MGRNQSNSRLRAALPSLNNPRRDEIPKLQAGLHSDEYSQRGAKCRRVVFILGSDNGIVARWLGSPTANDSRGARDEVFVEGLVLFCADGVAEGIAENGVELIVGCRRRGGWGGGSH